MNIAELIERKRDGDELNKSQIAWLIENFVSGVVRDEQMAAWAMAVFLRGMTTEETAHLTDEMLHSGVQLEWESSVRPCVDKHSTGGIGDKTSLILAPLLACCGLRVPMISGRGLGATGGTLDKLESIPGFRANLSIEELQKVTRDVGCVITGATETLVPADRKLYGLRDVTATVPSIPLITASIMSKKLAEGLDALVLDVKFGSGAFMKTLDQARLLAQSLVATGNRMGVATTAILSDMNQPLGRKIGNSLEVEESLAVLSGGGPADVRELSIQLASELLVLTGRETGTGARQHLEDHLDSGQAREKFHEMVAAQNGSLESPRPTAPCRVLESDRSGYVKSIDSQQLGYAVIDLGGGRRVQGEQLDHSTGLEILVRVGERIDRGQPIMNVFAKGDDIERVQERIVEAFTFSDDPVEPLSLVADRIESDSQKSTLGSSSGTATYWDRLTFAAREAQQRAYAKYSNFRVGAALLAEDGTMFTGANVENISYSLTQCAERVALGTAITSGKHHFQALAVSSPGGVPPCGACRQALAEFCDNLPILLLDSDTGTTRETDLNALLPDRDLSLIDSRRRDG